MTFYEAALHVLEKEGKPLHYKAITEKALADKLLSHVGKDPDATMYFRLAAMAKRKGDRKVVATEPGTFGLLDWGVQEDPTALDQPVLPLPEEGEPPLRPRERHPLSSKDNVRTSGRGERSRKHREEERDRGRRHRLPALPELAFEVLSQVSAPLAAVDLAASLREREQVSEDLGAEALLAALREDNRRRTSQDRRPLFILGERGEVAIDRAGSPGEGVPVELQAAFAQALGLDVEGGMPRDERRDRPERAGPGFQRLMQQAREHHRNIGRVARRRFGELDAGALELAAVALLEAHGFREVRAAKRTRDGVTLVGRRRDGLLDVRYAARVVKGTREITRQDVQDLRRDLANLNVQVALVVAAGEADREARAETQAAGALALLWCGDGLSEKLLEKRVGAVVTEIEIFDLDEGFFRRVREQGEVEERRREERRLAREAREERERAERVAREATAVASGSSEPVGASQPEPAQVEVHVDLTVGTASPRPAEPPAVEASPAATAQAEGQAVAGASEVKPAPGESPA